MIVSTRAASATPNMPGARSALARYFLEYLNTRVGDDRVRVHKVRCFETPTSVATYQI